MADVGQKLALARLATSAASLALSSSHVAEDADGSDGATVEVAQAEALSVIGMTSPEAHAG